MTRIEIRKGNEGALSKLDRFNRKAERYGFGGIKVEFIEEFEKEFKNKDDKGFEHKFYLDYLAYEVTGEIPTFKGWEFVAKIEYDEELEKNLIFASPKTDLSVPADMREGITCDHCGHNRYRKAAYIIHHKEEGFKKVGSSCINDFFDMNLDSYIKLLAAYANFEKDIHDEIDIGDGMGSYGGEWNVDIIDFLTGVVHEIKEFGYTSRTNASIEGSTATADSVFSFATSRDSKVREEWLKVLRNKDFRDRAELVKAHFASKTEEEVAGNEYLTMLRNLGLKKSISFKLAGYLASMPTAYYREMEKKAEAEMRVDPVWVGEEGEKIEGKLRLVNTSAYSSMYGFGTMYIFTDETESNRFIWFTTAERDYSIDSEYDLRYTIKKHDEYRGKKQNIITRVKDIKKK